MGKKMRKPNGGGSVYKMGGRRRKPWAFTGWVTDKETGKQVKKLLGTFETRKEAEQAYAAHMVDPLSLKYDVTLKALYEQWYNGLRKLDKNMA